MRLHFRLLSYKMLLLIVPILSSMRFKKWSVSRR